MLRAEILKNFEDQNQTTWDFVIIGGGATGLGTAIEAATRGYKTLLLEQSDFAKSTSSKKYKTCTRRCKIFSSRIRRPSKRSM